MPAPKGNQYGLGNTTAGRPEKFSKEELDEMALELIEWAKKPDSKIYRKWLAEKAIYPQLCTTLKERSKAFSDAIEYAKYLIGVRREELTIDGEFPEGVFKSTQACYDSDVSDWALKLKTIDQSSKPTTIVIEDTRGKMRSK